MPLGTGKRQISLKHLRQIAIHATSITVSGIPPEAFEYVINGKAALEWVVERHRISVDQASGIVDDANDWGAASTHSARYSLELIQRVITMSLETVRIVNGLPRLGADLT